MEEDNKTKTTRKGRRKVEREEEDDEGMES